MKLIFPNDRNRLKVSASDSGGLRVGVRENLASRVSGWWSGSSAPLCLEAGQIALPVWLAVDARRVVHFVGLTRDAARGFCAGSDHKLRIVAAQGWFDVPERVGAHDGTVTIDELSRAEAQEAPYTRDDPAGGMDSEMSGRIEFGYSGDDSTCWRASYFDTPTSGFWKGPWRSTFSAAMKDLMRFHRAAEAGRTTPPRLPGDRRKESAKKTRHSREWVSSK